MKNWVEFWNEDNPIYVNPRHKLLHYRLIAQDIAGLIQDDQAVLLDYGCGEALSADLVLRHCRKLILSDAAPKVREKLGARFGERPDLAILSPEAVHALAPNSLDLIIVHSLAQYLTKSDFAALLAMLADKLRQGGRLILGDILPIGLSPLRDAWALLHFGFSGGFLLPAFWGLMRAALSDYRKMRGALGLAQYDGAEILAMLEGLGLTARRLDKNLGHNQARMAFVGLKAAG